MTDHDLKRHVQNALDGEPSFDATDIGVSVDEGVVTLRGNVASYGDKIAAERVALRVDGVKAIANDLVVRLASAFEHTDTELAQAAVTALAWNRVVPRDRLTVTVTNGWVTLKGSVDWRYQKDAAERAVRDLTGVRAVVDEIAVKTHVKAADVREKIDEALRRSVDIDAGVSTS